MAPQKRVKGDHVVWDTQGPRETLVVEPDRQMVFRCLHCADRFVLPLPVSVPMAAVIAAQYGREHRRCKAPPAPAPSPEPPDGVMAKSGTT